MNTEPAQASWDETWMAVAETVAEKRGRCVRAAVGVVVVGSNHRVLGVAYNGAPSGWETGSGDCTTYCPRGAGDSHLPGYSDCVAVHAEANGITYTDSMLRQGGTIYITRAPCLMCAKLIAASGLARVVCGEDEGGRYHVPGESIAYLKAAGLEVEVYAGG
jgi:dCMP deaminase